MKLPARASPQNCSMVIPEVFLIGTLKNLLKFLEHFWKKTHPEAFIFVFSGDFCEAFKNTFFTEHLQWSWSLSLKKFYIVGVHKNVFEWLDLKEFLTNSKNYLCLSCISISRFSLFSIT